MAWLKTIELITFSHAVLFISLLYNSSDWWLVIVWGWLCLQSRHFLHFHIFFLLFSRFLMLHFLSPLIVLILTVFSLGIIERISHTIKVWLSQTMMLRFKNINLGMNCLHNFHSLVFDQTVIRFVIFGFVHQGKEFIHIFGKLWVINHLTKYGNYTLELSPMLFLLLLRFLENPFKVAKLCFKMGEQKSKIINDWAQLVLFILPWIIGFRWALEFGELVVKFS